MTVVSHASQMTLDDIAPELRPNVRPIPRLPVANPVAMWVIQKLIPLTMRRKRHKGVRNQTVKLANGIPLYLYIPKSRRSQGALLWIHGGGLVTGSALQDDDRCAETACELGIVVVSATYRLAPSSRYPAALDDCFAAWEYLVQHADALGVQTGLLAIGGQSAGGGLAAALVQRIYDTSDTQPIAQWLFCPMLDDRTAADNALDGRNHLIWNNKQNRHGWQAYLGVAPGTASVPSYAAPARRTDLAGLPPAWIGCGDVELFYQENRIYAERLTAAGISATLDVVPNTPHGFESVAWKSSLARAYRQRARLWLVQQIANAQTTPIQM